MALTRDFKELVQKRVACDPAFGGALLREGKLSADQGRRHGEDRDIGDPLSVAEIRHYRARPEVGGELRRSGIRVTEPDLGPVLAQRQRVETDRPALAAATERPPRHLSFAHAAPPGIGQFAVSWSGCWWLNTRAFTTVSSSSCCWRCNPGNPSKNGSL